VIRSAGRKRGFGEDYDRERRSILARRWKAANGCGVRAPKELQRGGNDEFVAKNKVDRLAKEVGRAGIEKSRNVALTGLRRERKRRRCLIGRYRRGREKEGVRIA